MADLASRITKPSDAGSPPAVAEAAESNGAPGAGGPGLWDSEANVQVSLTDLQSDESTPFHSATTFKDLNL